MAFKGWPAEALEFFAGLGLDNSKSYWQAHRVYERDVKAPMVALTAELADEFGAVHLFRPYRDVRFSADKSPYKTTIAAMVGDRYVQLSAGGLVAGAGLYHLAPDQLDRYRAAVAAESTGVELAELTGRLRAAGLDLASAEALKTAPRGYPKDHPRAELLRMKGLVVMRTWEPAAWLATAAAKKKVADVFRAGAPLLDWLGAHVGPAAEQPARSRARRA